MHFHGIIKRFEYVALPDEDVALSHKRSFTEHTSIETFKVLPEGIIRGNDLQIII